MNLVIIGGKNPEALAQSLHRTFDDIQVMSYADTNLFLSAVANHSLDVHRMLLLQDGIDNVSDDDVYRFVDFVQMAYPAMKVISICKDQEGVSFLGDLLSGPNYAHFMPTATKVKMIIDFASMGIPQLLKKYSNFAYIKKINTQVEIIDEVPPEEQVQTQIDNSEVPGYIAGPEKEQKRGLFGKIFGVSPKKKNKSVLKDGDLKPIGQNQGVVVDEFSTQQGNVFESDTQEEPASFGNENDIDFSVFNDGDSTDLGLGEMPMVDIESDEANQILDNHSNDENYNSEIPDFDDEDESSEKSIRPIGYTLNKNEDNNEKDNFEVSIVEEPVVEKPIQEQEPEIDIAIPAPKVDFSSLKEKLEKTELQVSEDLDSSVIAPIDVGEVDGDEIDLFGQDMEKIMSDYEDSNKEVVTVEKVVEVPVEVEKVVEKVVEVEVEKVVEKVVEKPVDRIVYVNNGGGSNTFRNKANVRVLIVTGDRRVGCTKFALNLANCFAKSERTLYVDFDRYRHGSLGYMNLDEILDEPEPVQNGINYCKENIPLNRLVHYYRKGGFDTLISMYGEETTDEQMLKVQEILSIQREYSTVVIDCPIENIYLLTDIISAGNVLICSEDDNVGLFNLITMLSGSCQSDKDLTKIYDRAYFVVGRRGNIDKFKQLLYNIVDLFDLESSRFNWNNIPVLGNLKGVKEIVERIGE